MATTKAIGANEWRKKEANGSSEILPPESGPVKSACLKAWVFLKKAWEVGVDDPRKVIHCVKVGLALTVVSLFYYTRPLYEGFGGNAMWAVITVVVIFEHTVGATICKCLNRAAGTFIAGFLAVGVHYIACQSGEKFEPIIVGVSVFLLASAATFSRFIPVIKARFDYGAMIFIMTFSLVSLSGYRVEKLLDLAYERLSTIILGTTICLLTSMLVCPIWAGEELYHLIIRNMDNLADSLDCCAALYFSDGRRTIGVDEGSEKKLEGYKCVLNSKAVEESMAGFARWEPAHGYFSFRHPWKLYLTVGVSMRSCACRIEALNSCLISETDLQAPDTIKKHVSDICLRVSIKCSSVIRELATNIKTMRKSPKLDLLIEEMNAAVEELQNDLKVLPALLVPRNGNGNGNGEGEPERNSRTSSPVPLAELIPLATFASLQIEIAARVEAIVDAVEKLGSMAEFKPATDEKSKKNKLGDMILADDDGIEEEAIKVLSKV
ncbi:aluminum-activated malate transporter 10-like [Diospyros lotus]|uniref:aluminum-activated malate transporter 10-like n=1 Tax=Diospyros lotus TaxID=55363 RepID=UPI00225BD862|nr:aluminum-activated malate transporter 10-like [Diospyros lotus]